MVYFVNNVFIMFMDIYLKIFRFLFLFYLIFINFKGMVIMIVIIFIGLVKRIRSFGNLFRNLRLRKGRCFFYS